MRTIIKHIAFSLPCLLILVVVAHADSTPCTTSGSTGCFNPTSGITNIPNFISSVLKAIVKIAMPIITVAMVYSGFLFVKAQGKPEALKVARTNFVYVVLGTLLILSAWELSNIIGGTVTQVLGN